MKKKFSQCGQDFDFIDWYKGKYEKKPKNINIVEIGANDGVQYSNSYIFENGKNKILCIEPNKEIFKELVKNRKDSICVNLAVSDNTGIVSFLPCESTTLKVPEGLNVIHRSDLLGKINTKDTPEEDLKKSYYVECKPLYDILEENNFPVDIDFMTIDTEGHELRILEAFLKRNDKYKVGFLCVETNEDLECKKNIYDLLTKHNYKLLCINLYDDYYIKGD